MSTVLLLAQAQYQEPFPFLEDYGPDYFPDPESLPGTYQQQVRLEPVVRPEKSESELETEPTEPGPLDCREEQYPCTRLYSVHKPCKQCLNSLCFYSLRRVYVINKEVCVRTVCAHEELLRGGFTALCHLCCFVCLYIETCYLNSSASVFSGLVSRSVLPLWRGSAEWPVFITRRKLREELWRLLIEHRDQGRYLPRYCRLSYHSSTSSYFVLLLPPSFSSLCLFDSSCTTHYSCAKSTSF
uniref:Microfibril associated protein 2 n=1 Tax=Dicentrarchus labrax TaxID=13489 RepID=A0A8P4KPA7_DICLA